MNQKKKQFELLQLSTFTLNASKQRQYRVFYKDNTRDDVEANTACEALLKKKENVILKLELLYCRMPTILPKEILIAI